MKKPKSIEKIYKLVLTALFSAVIAVSTAFIKFNTGINEGYLHFGDSMIYLSACILPLPYACLSAAIGGGIADVIAGAAVWAPATAVIKALNALPFALAHSAKRSANILNKRTAPMPFISAVVTIFGYYLAEGIMYSFPSALVSVPFSIIQSVGSAIIFYILAAALDKINFKSRIYK